MNIRTHMMYCTVVVLLSQLLFSLHARAQEDDSAALIAIIDAVAKGWEQADEKEYGAGEE